MNYRLLGKSTLNISEIGFGCMSLGENDPENATLVNKALEIGINFFDTADIYREGMNEKTLGKILKGKRAQAIVSTKAGNQSRRDGNGWDWNPRKEYILQAINGSLQRLQTDYIDLYQLHGGTITDPIDETIEAFEILQKEGKIRYYGISSIRPNVIREYIERSGMVSVMMQYSLLDRRPEETCLRLLQEKNIGVLARGSLAKGLLANKPATGFLGYNESEVSNAMSLVSSFTRENRTAAQTSIQYVLNHPAITSAVVGLRTFDQLEDAAGTTNAPPLSGTEINTLAASIPVNYYDQHR